MSPKAIEFFRSATGPLPHLSRCTRPDTTHSVMVFARIVSEPGARAMSKLRRVLRYFKTTIQSESPTVKMPKTEKTSRHTLTQTTQVTKTMDTLLLELL